MVTTIVVGHNRARFLLLMLLSVALVEAIGTFTLKKLECSKQAYQPSQEVPKMGFDQSTLTHTTHSVKRIVLCMWVDSFVSYLTLNNLAWNNGIGPRFYFVGLRNLR